MATIGTMEAFKSYFANGVSRMTEPQIEAYEDFIHNKLPLIIRSTPPVVVWHEQDEALKKYKYEFRLSFDNMTYMKPRIQEATGRIKQMLPHEARVRNFTYAAQMFVDIKFTARTYSGPTLSEITEQSKTFEGVSFGKIPVMLGSSLCLLKDFALKPEELGECPYDPYGYFIIHGTERTILSQEKVADNRIMVFYNKKTSSKYSHHVEIKSLHESFTMPPKKLEIRLSAKFNGLGYPLMACVPRFTEEIPLMIFFRAIGIETDKQVADLVGEENIELLAASFKDAADLNIFTQAEAIQYLTTHLQYATNVEDKNQHVRNLLDSEFLPHVQFAGEDPGTTVLNARKSVMIGTMIRRLLLTVSGKIPLDDRDAYPNKRVVTTGALLTHLFRQLFQKVCKDLRTKFVHEINNDAWKKVGKPLDVLNINNLYKILKVSSIEGKVKQALATGNFTVQGLGTSGSTSLSNATKAGVSQVLNRLSYNATLSHLRRIQTPVEKSGKLLAPRKLHGTSWGFVCPVETPEGHSVGIVKTMSILTTVSQHVPSFVVTRILEQMPEIEWMNSLKSSMEGTAVNVNGVTIGYTKNPDLVYKQLKKAKTSMQIHPHISIAWNVVQNQMLIETDSGRLVRPVFRLENGKLIPPPVNGSWNDWVKTCVEYIDSSESETIRIAMLPEDLERENQHYTHCEIHPTAALGHMANTIPLSDHNQSPRNTYQSAMGKQAISMFARNYMKRLDKNAYLLCSPTRPLVETQMMNVLKMDQMPFGENIIVAIACYGGYNQEDSVILNQSAVKRGLFRALYSTMYKDEEHRNVTSGREERFMKPRQENTRGFKNSSYAAVSDNGIPQMHAVVNENDVLIGKAVTLKSDPHGYMYRDVSTIHKNGESCRVDGVWQDKNADGYPFVKVRVTSERVPQIGDKFCLTPDHEVLTLNRGWVEIPNVTTEDLVAQLNRETGRMEYVNPLETMVFDHEGEMYEVETQGVNLKTTLNHRMWVQKRDKTEYELITAEKMRGKRVRFQSSAPISFTAASYSVGNFHFSGSEMNDFLTFIGIWFAEGWVEINETEHIRKVVFAANKPRVQEALFRICKNLEFNHSFNKKSLKFYVNERDIAYMLKPFSIGAINKKLPEWVFKMSPEQSAIFVNGMCLGDGHETETSYIYTTSSVHLRDDIQRLCQHAGWTSEYRMAFDAGYSTTMKDGRTITHTVPSWRIGIRRTRTRPTLNHGHIHTQSGQRESITLYSGKVYCIRVPSEVFLVRRNGIPVFTGNSSRHGQKGTCGILLPESDMPFTANGLRPDLIMNPHAVPSRMTIAQLLETMFGKVCVQRGNIADGTPYTHMKIDDLRKHMVDLGLHPYGNEVLYNGQTGEMMEAEIFMGPTFYQRLKHMVIDKTHSRARGPIVSLTRQPCEGRSRDGGLRVGEMERDCMLTHGTAAFTKERLMDVSDPFETGICRDCGSLAIVNEKESLYECRSCGNRSNFEIKTIPYALKLYINELEAMHISPRIVFE